MAADLPGVQRLIVLVDRNPIRKVLALLPLAALPGLSFCFKLEQASPVRALALTDDGLWHVGGTWVASSGGLVFADRVPTTPHADLAAWQQTLALLGRLKPATVVPSHGPVHQGDHALQQTRAYLQWLDADFARWAAAGWGFNEVLRATPTEPFGCWAAWPAEYTRNVAHLYPRYERAALQLAKPP